MTKAWTVQAAYMVHYANTVTVEADTLEEALDKAIEAANDDPAGWRSTGHVTETHIDAVCEGAGDPWGPNGLPVPDRYSRIDGATDVEVRQDSARVGIVDG